MPEPSYRQPTRLRPGPVRPVGPRLLATLPFGLILFGLWLILSSKRDSFHLTVGALTACVVALLAARLVAQSPPIAEPGGQTLGRIPWYRFATYLLWLGTQVVVASLQVAYVVLHPRLPVSPRVLRVRVSYPHTMARLTLANSITLTPGTVTLDVDGDEFLVHALTDAGGRELERGSMPDRVSRLYGATGERTGS